MILRIETQLVIPTKESGSDARPDPIISAGSTLAQSEKHTRKIIVRDAESQIRILKKNLALKIDARANMVKEIDLIDEEISGIQKQLAALER